LSIGGPGTPVDDVEWTMSGATGKHGNLEIQEL